MHELQEYESNQSAKGKKSDVEKVSFEAESAEDSSIAMSHFGIEGTRVLEGGAHLPRVLDSVLWRECGHAISY
ncbi:MAG: hypothetical protein OXC30_05225 [Alphaproteobacteria bacterium]|nr:hypothetical protein [Alphaproteobacteria bacterium]